MGVNQKLSPLQQLQLLRTLTERLGIIHEAQLLQLKRWPFLVDPRLKDVEIGVDVERKIVAYLWTSSGAWWVCQVARWWHRDKIARGLDALGRWVAELLGNDWLVTVDLDGTRIYPVPQKSAEPQEKTD